MLIAEDYEDWSAAVARIIRRALPGAVVTICTNAAAALRALDARAFDFAVIDVVLCDAGAGTGRDVARDAVSRGVPTVLTSSHTKAPVRGARFVAKDDLLATLPSMLAALLTP